MCFKIGNTDCRTYFCLRCSRIYLFLFYYLVSFEILHNNYENTYKIIKKKKISIICDVIEVNQICNVRQHRQQFHQHQYRMKSY